MNQYNEISTLQYMGTKVTVGVPKVIKKSTFDPHILL